MELEVECVRGNEVELMTPIWDVPEIKGSWVQNASLE